MKALAITLPKNGLVAFNHGGYLCYGVFLGLTPEGRIKLYSPDRTLPHVQIDSHDNNNYSCQLLPYDHQELCKKSRQWWRRFVIEVAGNRYIVTRARDFSQKHKGLLIYYRDETRRECEILFEDPRLKFVGHN